MANPNQVSLSLQPDPIYASNFRKETCIERKITFALLTATSFRFITAAAVVYARHRKANLAVAVEILRILPSLGLFIYASKATATKPLFLQSFEFSVALLQFQEIITAGLRVIMR